MDKQQIVNKILPEFRSLRFNLQTRIKLDNALGAYVRRELGWSVSLPEKERNAIKKQAANMIEHVRRSGGLPDGVDPMIALTTAAVTEAMKPFKNREETCKKNMEKLVKQLPVWTGWGAQTKGVGALGIAVVVGIAGNLDDWRSLPGLYKRLGLAPHEGMAYSTWRMKGGKNGVPKLTAEDWKWAGYSPRNRAAIYGYLEGPICWKGAYAELYKERRAVEDERTDSKMTAYMRARRYTVKRCVKHMFQAWRREAAA